ncbi:putative methyltransferase [Paramyrothecium foliicola]|nr:putative methyltransferase [Paramyrothecium foliicola]
MFHGVPGVDVTYREEGDQIQAHHRDDEVDEVVDVPRHEAAPRLPGRSAGGGVCVAQRAPGCLEGVAWLAGVAELGSLCDGLAERGRVGALDGLDGLAAMEDYEGGHGGDAVGSSNAGLLVNVDLGEGDLLRARVLLCEALKVRCDHLARAAPVGVDCNGHAFSNNDIGAGEQRLPLAGGLDVYESGHRYRVGSFPGRDVVEVVGQMVTLHHRLPDEWSRVPQVPKLTYHVRQRGEQPPIPQAKRKTGHTTRPQQNYNPSTIFIPTQGGRPWTLSVAIPTSVLVNSTTADQRMTLPGRLARALAIFSIDEVIIFDDSPVASRPRQTDQDAYTGDIDPSHFLAHILSFLEAPPFMRKSLFPLHPNLRLTGLLPTLDMPHHPNPRDWIPYKEGVTLPGPTSSGSGTLVEVGLEQPVEVADEIPPKTRVTLQFSDDENQLPECVHPTAPRTEGGYYWGYSVRKCGSLSSVFTESPYENGYDISIGTSERGVPASRAFPYTKKVQFQHLLVVFGGPRGLEYAAMNDEQLNGMDIQGSKTKELFDHWINAIPNQGSRSIRTDEAIYVALAALRHVWESS